MTSKLVLSMICGLSISATFLSQEVRADAIDDLRDCAQIQSSGERLGCYDAAMVQIETQGLSMADVAAAQSSNVAGPNTSQSSSAETFGSERRGGLLGFGLPFLGKKDTSVETFGETGQATRSPEGQITEISIAITEFRYDGYGRLIVTLENGQVWRQTDGEKVRVSKRKQNFAAITAARMGGYLLRVNGKGVSARVVRVE